MKNSFLKAVTVLSFLLIPAIGLLSCSHGDSDSGSCTDSPRGAYVRVCVPFASDTGSGRTAVPSSSGGSFPVKSYVITASKTGMSDVSATLTDLTAKQKLSLESEGSWTVTVNGYASDTGTGEAICTGSGTISVSAAPYYDGYASVTVYPSGTGTGTISLAVSVPATVKGAKVTLTGPGTDTTAYAAVYTTAADGGMTIGTDANTFTISSLTATGSTEAKAAFTAGAYTMTVQLYNSSTVTDSSTLIYRRTEAVAVWQGFATDTWINVYALQAGSTTDAAYSSTLTVTEDDLADTNTSWQSLTIKAATAVGPTSIASGDTLGPYIMNTDETAELLLTVNKNQTAYVKVDGNQPDYTVSMTDSAYTLTYTLPTPSSCTDNTVTVTVFASNGVYFGSYTITYGALYVDETNGQDSDIYALGSKASPYKTIGYAVSMLPSSSDANNKIILQSDITANTTGAANGCAADSSLVSFNYATAAKPLVLTIDGGGHALKGDGTPASNRRVMYVGGSVTLTLQNVTLTGGYATNGGGIYLTGGTLTLGADAALQGNTAASGGGVYVAAGTFVMKNISVVAYTNDVYLAAGTYITVDPSFTMSSGNYGAVITSEAGNSIAGTKVLAAESGLLSYAQCNMFALTPVTGETGTISTLYCITPDASGKGVTAKAGATSSGMTVNNPVAYALAPAISSRFAISMTIKNIAAGTTISNPTNATITLYQNGSSLASITGCTATTAGSVPSLSLPYNIPGGSYALYMQATVSGKTYSATSPIIVPEAKLVDTADALAAAVSASAAPGSTSVIYLVNSVSADRQTTTNMRFWDTTIQVLVPAGKTVTIARSSSYTGPLFSCGLGYLQLGSEDGGTLILDGGAGADLSSPVITAQAPLVQGTSNGELKLYNVTLQNNYNGSSSNYGGAISMAGTDKFMCLYRCRIQNCYSVKGGAIYRANNFTINLDYTTITGCKAVNGGGLYLVNYSYGTYLRYGSAITSCSATELGGGIYMNAPVELVYSGAALSANTDKNGNSQIYIAGRTLRRWTSATTYTDITATGEQTDAISIP